MSSLQDGFYVKLHSGTQTYYGAFSTEVEAKLFVSYFNKVPYESVDDVTLFLVEEFYPNMVLIDVYALANNQQQPLDVRIFGILRKVHEATHGDNLEFTQKYYEELILKRVKTRRQQYNDQRKKTMQTVEPIKINKRNYSLFDDEVFVEFSIEMSYVLPSGTVRTLHSSVSKDGINYSATGTLDKTGIAIFKNLTEMSTIYYNTYFASELA